MLVDSLIPKGTEATSSPLAGFRRQALSPSFEPLSPVHRLLEWDSKRAQPAGSCRVRPGRALSFQKTA